jgi:hypothetical protein
VRLVGIVVVVISRRGLIIVVAIPHRGFIVVLVIHFGAQDLAVRLHLDLVLFVARNPLEFEHDRKDRLLLINADPAKREVKLPQGAERVLDAVTGEAVKGVTITLGTFDVRTILLSRK